MKTSRWAAATGAALLTVLTAGPVHAATATATATATAAPYTVTEGQSIQQAIDAAQPGDTILVAAGTYKENLRIRTAGLTLRGANARDVIIEPATTSATATPGAATPSGTTPSGTAATPAAAATTPATAPAAADGICAGAGICVTGTTAAPLTGVTVAGLTVTGYPTYGIAASDTDGLTVRGVHADHNGQYGIGQQKSVRARFTANVATDNGEAGLFVANTVDEEGGALDTQGTALTANVTSGNKDGIVLRRVRNTTVQANTVTGNCAGMFLVGDEGVPQAGDLTVRGNAVMSNTRYCAATSRLPFVQGAGIVLTGIEDTLLERNVVTGNTGDSTMSGGVVFFHSFVNVPNTANTVRDNVLLANGPADVSGWDAGTGNSVTGNTCRVSLPAGRC